MQVQVLRRRWRTETFPPGLGSPKTHRFTTSESYHYVNPDGLPADFPPAVGLCLAVGLGCLLSLSLDGI